MLKNELYVEKTEKKANLSPLSEKTQEPSSYFKGRALVQKNGSVLSLRLQEIPVGVPRVLQLPRGLALKEGQVLEVILRLIEGKWQVEIPHTELYQDLSPASKPALSDFSFLLLKMGLAPAGREAKILSKFATPSLWGRRLLAMGILDKRSAEDLALLNAFAHLSWGEPKTAELQDLLSKPFKSRKGKGGLDWYLIPFETLYGDKKHRGSLNLGFQEGEFSKEHLKFWSFLFPLSQDWLVLQAKEGKTRSLKLTLSSSFGKREGDFRELQNLFRIEEKGDLRLEFRDSPQDLSDPWEEDFS